VDSSDLRDLAPGLTAHRVPRRVSVHHRRHNRGQPHEDVPGDVVRPRVLSQMCLRSSLHARALAGAIYVTVRRTRFLATACAKARNS
jgi:hypothetical protein